MQRLPALALILLLASSIIMMVEFASAKSIPKVSVPEFTVKVTAYPYDVPTTVTSTINPYTGEVTNTTHEGYQVNNRSIEVWIKNQLFRYSSNGLTYFLYYNIRTKPHFEGDWNARGSVYKAYDSPYNATFKSYSYSDYLSAYYEKQSNSEYTVLSYQLGDDGSSVFGNLHYNYQLDFQVEAAVGHESERWVQNNPLSYLQGGYYVPAIAYHSTSGWSETQTLTIGNETSVSPTATVPEFPSQLPLTIGAMATIALFTIIVKKRKNKGEKL